MNYLKKFFFGDSDNSTSMQAGGRITINGTTYKGNSIQIKDGNIKIDGKSIDKTEERTINIKVVGDVNELHVDACDFIQVQNVGDLRTSSGDVEVSGNVLGSIKTTSGDIDVGDDVGGNVTSTSGDIHTRHVKGNVNTVSGNITKY